MLAKICARGKSFGGVLRYVMDVGKKATHEKQAEFVCSNCVLSGDYKEVLEQFNDVRKVRDNVERPVWHCALSLKAGESVDNWEDCVREFMDKMGFTDENLWVAYKHNDTDHDHVHIIANRVGLDGKLWQGKNDRYKAVAACQEISKKQGLAIVERTGKKDVKDITSQELNMALRRGELPPRQKLQKLLTAVIPQCSTVVELCEQLTALNVQVHPNLASTGRLNGFAFELDGVSFKGSDLGKKFTWKAIEKAGVSYEQARDAEELRRYQVQPTAGAAKAEYRNQELSQGTEGLDLGVPGQNGSSQERAGSDRQETVGIAGREHQTTDHLTSRDGQGDRANPELREQPRETIEEPRGENQQLRVQHQEGNGGNSTGSQGNTDERAASEFGDFSGAVLDPTEPLPHHDHDSAPELSPNPNVLQVKQGENNVEIPRPKEQNPLQSRVTPNQPSLAGSHREHGSTHEQRGPVQLGRARTAATLASILSRCYESCEVGLRILSTRFMEIPTWLPENLRQVFGREARDVPNPQGRSVDLRLPSQQRANDLPVRQSLGWGVDRLALRQQRRDYVHGLHQHDDGIDRPDRNLEQVLPQRPRTPVRRGRGR